MSRSNPSIGIVTVAYGDTYRAFLPQWAQAINELSVQPDQVTVVTDDVAAATELLKDLQPCCLIVAAEGEHKHHPQVYVNIAIRHTVTDWVCKMDVDDRILPHAFDELLTADCDVFLFGMRYRGSDQSAQSVSADEVLRNPNNLIVSGSPFHRTMWIGNEFIDMIFEDWAFWIGCARKGATFGRSTRIDYEYGIHDNNISARCDEAHWRQVIRSMQ